MCRTGQGYPEKKVKNKAETHSDIQICNINCLYGELESMYIHITDIQYKLPLWRTREYAYLHYRLHSGISLYKVHNMSVSLSVVSSQLAVVCVNQLTAREGSYLM